MPYKSDAQRRLFHAKLKRHAISADTVHEFDDASEGEDLPEKAHHGPAFKRLTDMRRSFEDHMRTQEDALINKGSTEAEKSDKLPLKEKKPNVRPRK